MTDSKPSMIVLMGGPGAGKGTFAKSLCANHEYKYIEAGAILRQMPPDSEIGQLIAHGNLIPDTALFDIMPPYLVGDTDILLDGFPRTIGQAKWLVQNYADKYDIHVLFANVPRDIIIKRLNKRAREGSTRADDASQELFIHRINTFIKTTMPAVDWLRDAPGIRFSDIDASGDLAENMKYINAALAQ